MPSTAPALSRRAFIQGAAAATAVLAGADLLAGTSSASAASANTLRVKLDNPVCIDPYNASENQGIAVTNLLFDALTKYNFTTGELEGLSAESWEANDDATQFTFHLREGMTFHNGDPVRAQDFVRGWNRVCNPATYPSNPSTVSYHLDMVGGYDDAVASLGELDLECPDDLTLVVNLSMPYADFPYLVTMQCLSPVPAAAEEDPDAYYLAPIGNGPFMMNGSWVDGQSISLVRYDGYWGQKPAIDGCDFTIFADNDAAFMEYQAGNLDLTVIPTGQFAALQAQYGTAPDGYTANPGAQCILGETVATYYIFLNCQDEALQVPEVRRAISYAINRQAICDTVWAGTRQPATSIVPPIMHGFEECQWPGCSYDPEQAGQLLDEAGFIAADDGSRGIKVALSYNSGGGHEDIMQLIASDLAAVGIEATLDGMEWAAYLDKCASGALQAGRMTWGASFPALDDFFHAVFYSDSDNNYSGYLNPEVDALIEAARQTVDDQERLNTFAQASALIADDMPVVPIAFYCLSYVASDRVHDLYIAPDDTSKHTSVTLDA